MTYPVLFFLVLLGLTAINLRAQEGAGPMGDAVEDGSPSVEAPPSLGGQDEMEGADYSASYVPGEAASPALGSLDLGETFSPDDAEEESASFETDAAPRSTESISLSDKSGLSPLTGLHHMPTAPASLVLPSALGDLGPQKPPEDAKKKEDLLKEKLNKKKNGS